MFLLDDIGLFRLAYSELSNMVARKAQKASRKTARSQGDALWNLRHIRRKINGMELCLRQHKPWDWTGKEKKINMIICIVAARERAQGYRMSKKTLAHFLSLVSQFSHTLLDRSAGGSSLQGSLSVEGCSKGVTQCQMINIKSTLTVGSSITRFNLFYANTAPGCALRFHRFHDFLNITRSIALIGYLHD